jgi:hypothetical protein
MQTTMYNVLTVDERVVVRCKPLKLKIGELEQLFREFESTRITKIALARKHGITRGTLDSYLRHREEIRRTEG